MVLKKGARCFTHLLIKSESKVLNAREGAMPRAGGKKYSYTAKGKKAAEKERERLRKRKKR